MKRFKIISLGILICFIITTLAYARNKYDETGDLINVAPIANIGAKSQPNKVNLKLLTDYNDINKLNDIKNRLNELDTKLNEKNINFYVNGEEFSQVEISDLTKFQLNKDLQTVSTSNWQVFFSASYTTIYNYTDSFNGLYLNFDFSKYDYRVTTNSGSFNFMWTYWKQGFRNYSDVKVASVNSPHYITSSEITSLGSIQDNTIRFHVWDNPALNNGIIQVERKDKNPPKIVLTDMQQLETIIQGTQFTPKYNVNAPIGSNLSCNYNIDDGKFTETKSIISTATTVQNVSFSSIDTSILSIGTHKITISVSNGLSTYTNTLQFRIIPEGENSDNFSILLSDTKVNIEQSLYKYLLQYNYTNYGVSPSSSWEYKNSSSLSIKQLINSTQGKLYDAEQFQKSLDDILSKYTNKDVDIMLFNDYTDINKINDLKSSLTNLGAELESYDVNLKINGQSINDLNLDLLNNKDKKMIIGNNPDEVYNILEGKQVRMYDDNNTATEKYYDSISLIDNSNSTGIGHTLEGQQPKTHITYYEVDVEKAVVPKYMQFSIPGSIVERHKINWMRFEGSNDRNTWDILVPAQSNIYFYQSANSFEINTTQQYRYYRLATQGVDYFGNYASFLSGLNIFVNVENITKDKTINKYHYNNTDYYEVDSIESIIPKYMQFKSGGSDFLRTLLTWMQFEASNDRNTWDVLVPGQSSNYFYELINTYEINTTKKYRYYRIAAKGNDMSGNFDTSVGSYNIFKGTSPIHSFNTSEAQNIGFQSYSDKYFLYISDSEGNNFNDGWGNYYSFGSLNNSFANYLKRNDFTSYVVSPSTAWDYKLAESGIQELTISQFIDDMEGTLFGTGQINDSILDIREKILSKIGLSSKPTYICTDEAIEYIKYYSDYEDDPQIDERFRYNHDWTLFENNKGSILNNNTWDNTSITQFDKTGKYVISYQAEDDPSGRIFFSNYDKWSVGENQLTLIVHNRPIADFNYMVNNSTFALTLTDTSYDIDHLSQVDKGIVQSKWKWKNIKDSSWTYGTPPSTLTFGETYAISLEVKDKEGAWSYPSTKIFTVGENHKPIAKVTLQKLKMMKDEVNEITDLSYDPDMDAIAEWHWRLLDRNNTLITDYLGVKPNLSTLQPGLYRLELTVKDNPVIPPSYWSEPYAVDFEVTDNLKLTATLTPSPAKRGQRIVIKATTDGFAKNLTVYFPFEISSLDPTLPLFKPITIEDNHVEDIEYFIPMGTPYTLDREGNRLRGAYIVTVVATKDAQTKSVDLNLDIQGNIYDGIKTQLK